MLGKWRTGTENRHPPLFRWKRKHKSESDFFGSDEIAQVYDYAGADATQLLESGTQQLKSLQSGDDFSLDVEGAEFEIGDIVGGRDYVTGISMKAKVTGVLRKSVGGNVTTEYTISDVLEG